MCALTGPNLAYGYTSAHVRFAEGQSMVGGSAGLYYHCLMQGSATEHLNKACSETGVGVTT